MMLNKNSAGLIISTRFGVHTFLMKKNIDVIVLNNEGFVKNLATLAPNKVFIWNPSFKVIIELPPGTIEKSKTQMGDRIKIYDNIT